MLISFSGFAVALTAAGPITPPQPDDLARVLADWVERRRTVAVARYAIAWDQFYDRPADRRDEALPGTATVVFDLPRGRARADWDFQVRDADHPGRASRARMIVRYDGREQFTRYHVDRDATLAYPELPLGEVTVSGWGHGLRWPTEFADPLLWASGVVVAPTAFHDNPPVAWRVDPRRFEASGRQRVGGRVCVVLREKAPKNGGDVTLWADPDRAGAVVRVRTESRSGTVSEVDVTYRETDVGWMPSGWVQSSAHGRSNGMHPNTVSRRTRVESAKCGEVIPIQQFQIGLTTGAVVHKADGRFRVGGNGAVEPIEVRSAFDRPPFGERVRRAVVGVAALVAGGLAALVALFGVLVHLRRRRVRATSPRHVQIAAGVS